MIRSGVRQFYLFLFFSVVLVQVGLGQKIFFRNYTVTDGLCANTVWDVEQDDQGYMWFGTKYGLSRFDGYNFKSYQNNTKVPGSIGNSFIRKIFRYNSTTFWIGTDEGVYVFDLKTEKFRLFEPLGKQFINDIVRTLSGEIWIATKEHGVYAYQPKTTKLVNYNTASSKTRISSNEVSKLLQDNDGNIWIGTYGKGIDVYEPKSGNIRHYKENSGANSLSGNVILELYKDVKGNIWIGTMSGGLNVWRKQSNDFKVYVRSGSNSISDNIVRSIYEPKPGILYLGTEKGLNILDVEKNSFTSYQNKNNDPFSISDDAIYAIFRDKEGGIWIGTYFGGLNYYHEKGSGFEFYYPSGVQNSLSGNAVSAFLETEHGKFWIGTEDGGLSYFDSEDKSFRRFPFSARQDSLSYHNIHALYKDKKGNIWIGMYTGGLNVYNPRTGKIRRYKSDPANPGTLSDNSIYSIDEDREGRIWISTISGLNLYDPAKDSFIRVKGKFLEKSCIYQVYQDVDGILWVATYDNGLIKIEKDNTLIQYAASNKPGAISSNKVICILDDERGNLWLGTDGGGLNILNKKTGMAKRYDQQDWLESSVVYGIVKDSDQKLWFSTNNGIYEYDPKSKRKRNFGKWDNLQSQQYNYKAYYKGSDGKLYFGGINGFNAFYPSKIKTEIKGAPISFTNFQLFNRDLGLDEPGSPLNRSVNYTSHITLKHDQSVISFEYAELSYIAPNKAQYAFIMDGFDKNWNYVGGQRKATYTNLPAGEYMFKVKAINNGGTENETLSSVKITILPPFYLSGIAYLIYCILAVVTGLLLRKYISDKARKKNEIKLEQLKSKNERAFYKQKIEFFTAMAHEIRTPLSLIIAPLEKLLSKRIRNPENKEQLMIMEENSDRLLTLVNQLLDFRRIESDFFEIRPEAIELVSLVNSIKDRFSAISYQKGLEFSVDTNVKKIDVYADPEAIMKILSNLLINAFKFTRTRIRIKINDIETKGNGQQLFSIAVEDDGIGVPKAQLDAIFKQFFKVSTAEHQYSNLGGTGIGLALAKALTEKHGGALVAESEEGVKTTFTVRIPFTPKLPMQTEPGFEEEQFEDADFRLTVLVVEDDPRLLDFLYKNFISEGYHTFKAGNGSEALKLLDKQQVDIVVSDVMMPVMDGIALCKAIKNDINYSHLPLILLTAKTNSEAEIEGLESGADAYISKPFKWKQVSLITKNLLDLQTNLKQRFASQPFEGTDVLPSGNQDKKFFDKLIMLIEERISDPQLSVEELGRAIGLSRSSLYKKVKAKTGYVPNEFIRIIRLKNAAKLLTNKEYNISEIGYMVGFNSHSYFSKCFFQQFKLTPTEFAEEHKKQTDHIDLMDNK